MQIEPPRVLVDVTSSAALVSRYRESSVLSEMMTPRVLISDVRRSIRRALRLACILSLWQAPVPWLHTHAINDLDLGNHVRHFHSEHLRVPDEASLGWHWHLVLPPWGQTMPSTSDEEAPAPCTATAFDPVIVVATTSWQIDVDCADWTAADLLMLSPLLPQLSGSGDLLPGLDLRRHSKQHLLSVCLC